MMKYKAAFFDMDGTLLNSLDDICGSIRDTLAEWGLPTKSNEELLPFIGYGAKHLCRGASGLLDEERLEQFHREYRAHSLIRNDPKTVAYDGMIEVVDSLKKAGYRLAICTNKPQQWTEKLAEKYFGPHVFEAVYGVHEGGAIKPDPAGLLEMCRLFGIDPKEAVMIGDSPVDVQTGKNAKMHTLAVTWGFRSKEVLLAEAPEMIVDTSKGILDYLLN